MRTERPDVTNGNRELLLIAAAAVVVTAAQTALRSMAAGPFARSYLTVTYSEGFVRRGLAGEVTQRILGEHYGAIGIEAVLLFLSATTLTVTVALLATLSRGGKMEHKALAVLVLALPIGIWSAVAYRGTEQAGFLVLAAYILMSTHTRSQARKNISLVLSTTALSVFSLAHEGILALFLLPLLASHYIISRNMRSDEPCPSPIWNYLSYVLAIVPALAAAALVLVAGKVNGDQVQRLHASAVASGIVERNQFGFYHFLGDDLGDSWALGRAVMTDPSSLLGLVIAISVMGAASWLFLSGYATPRSVFNPLARALTSSERHQAAVTAGLLLALALPYLGLLALAHDWIRWISWYGVTTVTLLLVAAKCDTRSGSPDSEDSGSKQLLSPAAQWRNSLLSTAAVTYLILLPVFGAIPKALGPSIRYLLNVP